MRVSENNPAAGGLNSAARWAAARIGVLLPAPVAAAAVVLGSASDTAGPG